jgi:hypothetical protein
MKFIYKLFLVILVCTACNSQKTISEKTIKKYKKKGYILGTLESSKNDECSYVIRIEGSDVLYDPVNIEEEQFSFLLSKETDFFFKFLPLRMKNRCNNISPIQLTEILKNP